MPSCKRLLIQFQITFELTYTYMKTFIYRHSFTHEFTPPSQNASIQYIQSKHYFIDFASHILQFILLFYLVYFTLNNNGKRLKFYMDNGFKSNYIKLRYKLIYIISLLFMHVQAVMFKLKK